MISAETIKGVQELLEKRGIEQKQGERLSDYVARGLHLSDHQAEVLLEKLHDGAEVDDAVREAGIAPESMDRDLLTQLARSLGSAAGRSVREIRSLG